MQTIFGISMHRACLCFAGLQTSQRLWLRHLEHHDLTIRQGLLRDAVPRLDDRCFAGVFGCGNVGHCREKPADGDGIGGVIGPLVNALVNVFRANDCCGQLDTACTPTIRHRHFARAKGDLIAGYCQSLQNSAADHPLGLLI